MNIKTIVFRPSVDARSYSIGEKSYKVKELEKAFETMELVDKTICGDRITYFFKEIDNQN